MNTSLPHLHTKYFTTPILQDEGVLVRQPRGQCSTYKEAIDSAHGSAHILPPVLGISVTLSLRPLTLSQGDQRLPHDSSPTSKPLDPSYLSTLGVLYSHHPTLSSVDDLATQRSYAHRDEITVSPAAMGDVYETKVKMFFDEHLHEDEEIRYIRDGAGYFDVRSEGDEWVRIRLEKDDLLILPAGIYHRFTTDEDNVS